MNKIEYFYNSIKNINLNEINKSNMYINISTFKQKYQYNCWLNVTITDKDFNILMHKYPNKIHLYALKLSTFKNIKNFSLYQIFNKFYTIDDSKYFISHDAIDFLFEIYTHLYNYSFYRNTRELIIYYIGFYITMHNIKRDYTEEQKLNNYYKCFDRRGYKASKIVFDKKKIYDVLVRGESKEFIEKIDIMLKQNNITIK